MRELVQRSSTLFVVVATLLIGALVGLVLVLTGGVGAATPAVQKVSVCAASGWDTSDSAPFNSEIQPEQFTHGGLKLEVTGPSQKQSAYVTLPAPVKLLDVNQSDTGLTYDPDHGSAPAYQLTMLQDPTLPPTGANWLGNLVRENGKWWATRPQSWPLVPDPGNGQTLEVYKAAYPDRFVYRVGFSLGSGAAASAGTLRNMVFQGTLWVFRKVCHESLPTSYTSIPVPTGGSSTTLTTTESTTSDATSATESTSTTSGTTSGTTSTSTATSAPSTSETSVVNASSTDDDDLAWTGATVGPLVALGALLLTGGVVLVAVRRGSTSRS